MTPSGTWLVAPAPPPPDFNLTIPSNSFTNMAGTASVSYTVNVNPVNGFNGAVNFSALGLQGGAHATFNPATIVGSGQTIMTLQTAYVKHGTSTFSINGQSGAMNRSASASLAVQDFTFQVAPSDQDVTSQGTATYGVSAIGINGFSDPIVVSGGPNSTNCPGWANNGALISQSNWPSTITPNGSSANGVLIAQYNNPTVRTSLCFVMTGTSRGVSKSAQVLFSIVPTSGFSVGVSSAAPVPSPGGTTFPVTVTPTGNFSGAVTLSASGMPLGVTASFFQPTIGNGNGSTTMSVNIGPAIPPGTYPITITGSSPSTSNRTAVANLIVKPNTVFSISAAPSTRTATPSGIAGFSVLVNTTQGFSGQVTLSTEGLPSGASPVFTPASLTGAGATGLNIVTSAATPLGSYAFTITATYGSITRSTGAVLVVSGSAPAKIMSPFPGATLAGNSMAKFTWDSGVGASNYELLIGSLANGTDAVSVYNGTGQSINLTMPGATQNVYMTLRSKIGEAWQSSGAKLYKIQPNSTNTFSSSMYTGATNPNAGLPNYYLPNNGTPTEIGAYNIEKCISSGQIPGTCDKIDDPLISWCTLTFPLVDNTYKEIVSSERRLIEGPSFALTFAIPTNARPGAQTTLNCVWEGRDNFLYGQVVIYDASPNITKLQQFDPDFPDGPFKVSVYGSNFGNKRNGLTACATNTNPCNQTSDLTVCLPGNSQDPFNGVNPTCPGARWTDTQIDAYMIPANSDVVGVYDVQVTTLGANGLAFQSGGQGGQSTSVPSAKKGNFKIDPDLPIKIFIIHGLGDTNVSMLNIRENLRAVLNPTKFYVDATFNFNNLLANPPVNPDTTCLSIITGGQQLAKHVRTNIASGQRVAFITHSMGGLLVRSMLDQGLLFIPQALPKPSAVVGMATLGTPHLGAPTLPLLDFLGKCQIQLKEMRSDLRVFQNLDAAMLLSPILIPLRHSWNPLLVNNKWFAAAGRACNKKLRNILLGQNQGCRDENVFSDGAVCDDSARLVHPDVGTQTSLGILDLIPSHPWFDQGFVFRHAENIEVPYVGIVPLMCGNEVGTQVIIDPDPNFWGGLFQRLKEFLNAM